MGRTVVVFPIAQEGNIRFRFRTVVQMNWILSANDKPAVRYPGKKVTAEVDVACVPRSNRRHYDNLPLDKFHPFIGAENAHLGHAVVFGYREFSLIRCVLRDFRDYRGRRRNFFLRSHCNSWPLGGVFALALG